MKIGTMAALSAAAVALAACAGEAEHAEEPESTTDIGEANGNDEVSGLVLDTEIAADAELVRSEGSAVSFDSDCIITEDGIAGIDGPGTLRDFVEAFPADTALGFQPVYMVDFGSICARSGGENAICAFYESYDVESYDGAIEIIALGAYSDQCRTAEGVGPGTSIVDAVDAYGDPRFGFSWENEGREYVSFAESPQAYSFRAESDIGANEQGGDAIPSGPHGGDYAGVVGDSYFETNTAHSDASIWEIWVTPSL